MEEIITYEVRDQIAYITLNKPEVGNCINLILTNQMFEILLRAAKDETAKVVVLQGMGNAFCTGGDVPRMGSLEGVAVQYDEIHGSGRVIKLMVTMEKPILCAVQGFAAGAGLGLALAADLVICEKSAKFMTAFSNVGLASDCGAAYLLTKAVGRHKAKELLLLSDVISAEEMYRLGIVSKIAEDGMLEKEVNIVAKRLLKRPDFASRMIKNLVNRSDDMNLEASIVYEESLQTMLMNTEDFREGTVAFLQKRQPVYGKDR